jgi:plasmid stabilization system protein ParE
MKIEFTNRAVRDLREISDYSRRHFGDRITRGLEARIRDIINRIVNAPESAPRVEQRPDMRVVLLVRYPFKIFYRIAGETIRILHVRHTARRPWDQRGD